MATVTELLDLVELDYEIHERESLRNFRWMRRYVDEFFDGRDADSVGHSDIQRYKLHRKNGGAAQSTINSELNWLSRGYHFAMEERIVDSAPKISRFRIGNRNARTDFIEPDKMKRVLQELPPDVRDLCEFLYFTGFRIGEAKSLLWEHVRGDEIVLPAKNTKEAKHSVRGAARCVPLVGRVEDVLQRRECVRSQSVQLVFHRNGKPIKDYRGAWSNACRRAGVKAVPYAVRRSFCRMAIDAGVDRDVAREFTGHLTDATFSRYNIVDGRRRRQAAERIGIYAQRRS